MDASERNKEIVRSFVQAGNARDSGALDTLVAEDFQRHCPATPDVEVRSLADFRRFLEQDLETFPDSRVEMRTLVAEGDRVGFWATYSGTQSGPMGPFAPSGRRMVCEFAGMFRIEGEKVAELWLTWDNLGILAQLGHWPPAE